jgi:hypothetical protein
VGRVTRLRRVVGRLRLGLAAVERTDAAVAAAREELEATRRELADLRAHVDMMSRAHLERFALLTRSAREISLRLEKLEPAEDPTGG